MKKIRFALFFSLVLCVLFSSSSFAANENESISAQEAKFQQIEDKQQKMIPQLERLKKDFSTRPESFGGIYFKGEQAVVQIVKSEDLEDMQRKKNSTVGSENIIIQLVNNSELKLKMAMDTLNNELDRDGSTTWGLDTKNNKIIIYTNDENMQNKVVKLIDPDFVSFEAPLNLEDQVGVGPSTWMNDEVGNCIVAFKSQFKY